MIATRFSIAVLAGLAAQSCFIDWDYPKRSDNQPGGSSGRSSAGTAGSSAGGGGGDGGSLGGAGGSSGVSGGGAGGAGQGGTSGAGGDGTGTGGTPATGGTGGAPGGQSGTGGVPNPPCECGPGVPIDPFWCSASHAAYYCDAQPTTGLCSGIAGGNYTGAWCCQSRPTCEW